METFLILVLVLVSPLIVARFFVGAIRPDEARRQLEAGAPLIDVRSPAEFKAGHLEGALNIPLDELTTRAPELLKDRSQMLLLHCHSGGRSMVGVRMLKRLGYRKAFNLGSFGRAARVSGRRAVRD